MEYTQRYYQNLISKLQQVTKERDDFMLEKYEALREKEVSETCGQQSLATLQNV